jgi:hypothetical protein
MDKLRFLMSELWLFLQPIIKVFLSDIGPILISTATAVVSEMAKTDMTGEQKKEAAFNAIKAALMKEGIQVATHLINTTIETAVAKLKVEE